MKKLPTARNKEIVIQKLGSEILLYDLKAHKAYCLNETLSTVYEACDGQSSFDVLTRNAGFTDELVFFALDELKKGDLLVENKKYTSPFTGMNRREVIKKVGFATVIALPAMASLMAPTAAMAASGSQANGTACATGTQCQSGFCTDGFCCENSCSGVCEKCNGPGRAGFCDAIPSGQDPDNECFGGTGFCNGARACG